MPQVWPRALSSRGLSLAKSLSAPAVTKLISRLGKFAVRSAALISDFAVLIERALQPSAATTLDRGQGHCRGDAYDLHAHRLILPAGA